MRDEEDRLRRIEDEKEAKLREEQMRLQEAERRHRVEGELRLQEERMRLELQSRKSSSPVKAVVTVAAILVVVAGAWDTRCIREHQTEIAAVNCRGACRIESDAKAAQVEFDRKVAAIQKEMEGKLNAAHTEEERTRIRAEAAERADVARQEMPSTRRQGRQGRRRHRRPSRRRPTRPVEKTHRQRRSARRPEAVTSWRQSLIPAVPSRGPLGRGLG